MRADGAYNKPGEKVKPVHKMAEEMLIVHNMILRTANSIYLQCLNVEKSPAVVPDFVGYAQNWAHFGELCVVFQSSRRLTREDGAPSYLTV